jgi:hypothetical protein
MRILPKSNILKAVVVLVFLLFCWAVFLEVFWIPANRHRAKEETAASPGAPVDEVIVRRMDVTGDGIEDEIRINIKGENWNKPFRWTLKIAAKGKTVFTHFSDDAWLDKFFNDKGYVAGSCKTYLECKKEYYLADLPENLFSKTDLPLNSYAYDSKNTGSVYAVAKDELTGKLGLSAKNAVETIDWMVNRMKTGQVQVLNVPRSPVQSESPRMYVAPVGQFVTIYAL